MSRVELCRLSNPRTIMLRHYFTVMLISLMTTPLYAQETVSINELLGSDLETAQIKLTYLGPQNEPIPTVVLTVNDLPVNWAAFGPWRRSEHTNDDIYQRFMKSKPSLTVSIEELRAVIQNLKQVTDEVNHTVADQPIMPWISCTITTGASDHLKGVEFIFNHRWAREFFVLMRGSLRADPKDITLMEGQANLDAMRTLQGWGCAAGLLPEGNPAKDVSAHIRVTTGALQFNDRTKRFQSIATLRNQSDWPINGPIALVLYPSVNVSLVNASGNTCMTQPSGREFINVPMPAQTLGPNEALEVKLEFMHEAGTEIKFKTSVLAGPGER